MNVRSKVFISGWSHIAHTNLCLSHLSMVEQAIFTCGKARRSMDHNWPSVCLSSLCESSQGSLYRPEKHGNIGNWGHWVQFWGQPWPPRSFEGHNGLRGHQDGRQRQYAHKYQGILGCRLQFRISLDLRGHLTSFLFVYSFIQFN